MEGSRRYLETEARQEQEEGQIQDRSEALPRCRRIQRRPDLQQIGGAGHAVQEGHAVENHCRGDAALDQIFEGALVSQMMLFADADHDIRGYA
ncbi:hypothetical protein D3C76_1596980 [compost metagenome]